MMKQLFFIVAVLAATLVADAQPSAGTVSFIPRVGLNLANITSNDVVVGDLMQQDHTLKSRLKPGFVAGFDMEYQATDKLFLSLGLNYSQQGSRYPDFERREGDLVEGYSDWHTNLHYLNLPLLVGCRVGGGFSVKTGLQMGMLVGAKEKKSETEIIPVEVGGRRQGNAVSYTEDLMDDCKKVDISIPIGVSYEFENVILDARYNFGLSRLYKLDIVKSRNSVVQLSVAYRLQLL